MLYPESEIPYPESKIPYPEQRNFNALLMQHVKSKWVTHFHWRASTQNPKSCSPNPRSHTQNNVLLMHVSCSKLKSSASLIFTGEAAPRIRNPIFSILHSQNNVANFGTDVLLICRTCAHDFHTQSKYHATRINFPVPRVQPLTCRIVVCGLHVQQNSQLYTTGPQQWHPTKAPMPRQGYDRLLLRTQQPRSPSGARTMPSGSVALRAPTYVRTHGGSHDFGVREWDARFRPRDFSIREWDCRF